MNTYTIRNSVLWGSSWWKCPNPSKKNRLRKKRNIREILYNKYDFQISAFTLRTQSFIMEEDTFMSIYIENTVNEWIRFQKIVCNAINEKTVVNNNCHYHNVNINVTYTNFLKEIGLSYVKRECVYDYKNYLKIIIYDKNVNISEVMSILMDYSNAED